MFDASALLCFYLHVVSREKFLGAERVSRDGVVGWGEGRERE